MAQTRTAARPRPYDFGAMRPPDTSEFRAMSERWRQLPEATHSWLKRSCPDPAGHHSPSRGRVRWPTFHAAGNDDARTR